MPTAGFGFSERRRIRPAAWVTQIARNLAIDLEKTGRRATFMIRDRDGKFPPLFDVILADAGIQVVLSGIQ